MSTQRIPVYRLSAPEVGRSPTLSFTPDTPTAVVHGEIEAPFWMSLASPSGSGRNPCLIVMSMGNSHKGIWPEPAIAAARKGSYGLAWHPAITADPRAAAHTLHEALVVYKWHQVVGIGADDRGTPQLVVYTKTKRVKPAPPVEWEGHPVVVRHLGKLLTAAEASA